MTPFNEDLLLKKLQGTANKDEEIQISDWLSESEENMKTYAGLRMMWQAGKIKEYASAPVLQKELAQFNRTIDSKELSQFNHTINSRQQQSRTLRFNRFLKYAAIMVGILVIGSLGYLLLPSGEDQVMVEYSVPVGGDILKFQLSDGSKIALNEGSHLSCPVTFKKGERVVKLEGEAFFDVAHMPKSRFVVETSGLHVEVTGTSFNVNTSGNQMQTVLVSGSIALTDHKGKRVMEMEPGQLAEFNIESRALNVTHVNTRIYTSWQEGLVVFDKAGLKEILDKMEKIYKIDFRYDEAKLSTDTNKYNFVFRREQPFDTVFKMLKFIAPLETYRVKHVNDNEISKKYKGESKK